jgi:hypothetical protein
MSVCLCVCVCVCVRVCVFVCVCLWVGGWWVGAGGKEDAEFAASVLKAWLVKRVSQRECKRGGGGAGVGG